jgi:hypothetical protein
MPKKLSNPARPFPSGDDVLDVLAILLAVAWLLGVASGYTWDGSIHVLIALAGLAVVIRLMGFGSR